ncbi:YbaB/EbfC family nucleoid-associated protein [Prauserella alba]|uniref:YbaB/EbfC family nucleoid-associated protein n=1 Tax=Prauserella alba TaxID=176898 RepID=A0ABP4G4G2_9PSEU|nr:YbaB/EbfC family nucleoid-associated protein [Prauserella alba]MCP2182031.1 YbaB/EbfC DNA-binding family protein [Prauserella alba]
MTTPGEQQSGRTSDPMKLADDLKQWAQGLQQQAERYGQLQSRLDATSVTRTSPDGVARVTVDSKGVPTELTITDRGRGLDPRELSAALMDTMRRAQAELRDTVADLTVTTVGEDGPASDIVAGYREQFPDPDPGDDDPGHGGAAQDLSSQLGAIEDDEPAAGPGGSPEASHRSESQPEPQRPPRRPTSRPSRDADNGEDDEGFGGSILR